MEAGAQKPVLPTAAKIGEKAIKNGPPKGDDLFKGLYRSEVGHQNKDVRLTIAAWLVRIAPMATRRRVTLSAQLQSAVRQAQALTGP